MLFMVVERFRNGDPVPVYRRFREQGRMASPGVRYVDSWVTADLKACFQVMDAPDLRSLEEWMSRWNDLVGFEATAVISSEDAMSRVGPLL